MNLKAYNDVGITPPNHICMFEQRFLSRVDVSREPVRRTVTNMVCLKHQIIQLQTKRGREYIYYRERWAGIDWRGIPVNPVDHTIGVFTKQFTRPHINDQTGEVDYNVLDPTKAQLTYYIPNNKKIVDEIISKSSPVNKQDIRFVIKFASADCPWGPRIDTRSKSHTNSLLIGNGKMSIDGIPSQTLKQHLTSRIRLRVVIIYLTNHNKIPLTCSLFIQ